MADGAPISDFAFRVMNDAAPALSRNLTAWKRGALVFNFVGLPYTGNTQHERYAHAVNDQLLRLHGVSAMLRMCAQSIGALKATPGAYPSMRVKLFELLRYHLIVHRTMVTSLKDVAFRMVATVWDLGVDPNQIKGPIVMANRHMTPPVQQALEKIARIAGPHRDERNAIAHHGGVPSLHEFDAEAVVTELMKGRFNEFETVMEAGFDEARTKIVASIERELEDFATAEAELHAALAPLYQRHYARLMSTP